EAARLDVGDGRNLRAITGGFPGPTHSRARAASLLEKAEQVGFADGMALLLELLSDVGKRQVCVAKADGFVGELLALGGGTGAGAFADKELGESGVGGEVTEDGTDGVGVKGVPLGQLHGGELVQEVGFADLVIAVSGKSRGAEQVGQLCGTS